MLSNQDPDLVPEPRRTMSVKGSSDENDYDSLQKQLIRDGGKGGRAKKMPKREQSG